MKFFFDTHVIGGTPYMVSDDGFVEYLRDDLGYVSMDINDLFTEFMDWIEDEAA